MNANPFWEVFVTIVAKKLKTPSPTADAQAMKPGLDKSAAKTLFDYCGRWFPNPVEPGLRIIGTPDRTAPVIVTANFHLTVRRVEKALADQNCYLLVVPTKGINAWCASAGGEMNTHSIIAALKTSRIGKRVDHRVLVLPQFSAPGIDIKLLKKRTGWNGKWGPAYAQDLPIFLDNGYTKTPQQCFAQFPPILPNGDATIHECFGVDGLGGDRHGHSSCLGRLLPRQFFGARGLFCTPGIPFYLLKAGG